MTIQLSNKPKIIFYIPKDSETAVFDQVGFGIEEEGIPFEYIQAETVEDVVLTAHRASHESSLLVGIAANKQDIVLHYRNLPKEKYVYRIKQYDGVGNRELRLLGTNAARLVKGVPFNTSSVFDVTF